MLGGRYDTTLYLKAQVDNLTGHNEELRQELKHSQLEATRAQVELDRSKSKVRNLYAQTLLECLSVDRNMSEFMVELYDHILVLRYLFLRCL